MKQNKRKTRIRSILKAIRRKLTRRSRGYTYNSKYFKPRHLARSIAKAKAEKAGVKHINSLFAHYWREWYLSKGV